VIPCFVRGEGESPKATKNYPFPISYSRSGSINVHSSGVSAPLLFEP
jgi:hypothetical protein